MNIEKKEQLEVVGLVIETRNIETAKNKKLEVETEQVRLFFPDDESVFIVSPEMLKMALLYFSKEKCLSKQSDISFEI
jgi:hypothetical protein